MKKLILCDIDSTLHPFENIVTEVIRDLYDKSIAYHNTTDYYLEDLFSLSPDQMREALDRTNLPMYINGMKPYPGAVEAIEEYMDQGYEIAYLTSRDASVYQSLHDWLSKQGFCTKKSNNLFCVGSINTSRKDSKESEKIRLAHMMADKHPCLFIDDNPVVLELCHFSSYLIPATIIHPWNKDVVEKYSICGATSWAKLTKELHDIYGLPHRDRKQQRRLSSTHI
jgi:FMN phosphatase YigB (HAD superfamily)